MKAIFIISEFNLLHRGHLRLFSACRDMADGGAVVAVMSGSAVQRGELAAQDKYARAEAAVRCGCDLVLELPAPWSCSGAEFFAGAGVSVASDFAAACGADGVLCFGSESGDIGSLVEIHPNILIDLPLSVLKRATVPSRIYVCATVFCESSTGHRCLTGQIIYSE